MIFTYLRTNIWALTDQEFLRHEVSRNNGNLLNFQHCSPRKILMDYQTSLITFGQNKRIYQFEFFLTKMNLKAFHRSKKREYAV